MNKLFKASLATLSLSVFSFSSALAAGNNSADVLKYIPADTPFVFASTEALPSDLADKFEPTFDGMLQAYQVVLRHVMAEQLEKMPAEEDGADDPEGFRGLMEEVLELMSLDGIRGAGIERDSAFAFYGNGLMPVLRIELSNEDKFDAVIARMEQKAGESLIVGAASGESYKYIDLDKMRFIIATIDDQAVFTMVPAAYNESQIALAIGADTQRSNLKKSGALKSIAKEYGYSQIMTGFVDTERLVGMFAGQRSQQDDAFFAAFGEEPDEISDICAAEMMSMAGIAPRMVFGYSEVDSDNVSASMVVEIRDDIASGLTTLPAAVPGLGVDHGGFMSLGFSLNLMALRNFYEAQLDAIEADPFVCEKFQDIQAGAAKGREVLAQPIPPVAYSFRGFVANIMDIEGVDLTTDAPPTSIDATILLAVENAESLLMMAAMMDPQIAALNLVPDGKPVKLELAQLEELAEIADNAYAALSADAISLSIGSDAETESASLLTADSSSPAPFMSMHMDSERYYSMIADAMEAEPAEGDKDVPPAVRAALRDAMLLSGNLYDRLSVDVQFTKRGIEVNSDMTIK